MTTIFNLRASSNATFHWTRDFSQVAAAYAVASGVIRMQARTTPGAADPPAYQWVSGATSGGVITFDPITNLCVFAAPESDMAAMTGGLAYDCRLELPGGECLPLFSGRIVWMPGVTRIASDATAQTGVSGLGDTVSVDGESSTSPVPLPLSLSAAVTAAASAVASAASLTSDIPGAVAAALAPAIAALGLGSAATHAAADFDAAGAAAAAQAAAQAYTYSQSQIDSKDTATLSSAASAAATAIAASMAPAALGAALTTWFATLPTTLPGSAGQWWNNGGTLAQS